MAAIYKPFRQNNASWVIRALTRKPLKNEVNKESSKAQKIVLFQSIFYIFTVSAKFFISLYFMDNLNKPFRQNRDYPGCSVLPKGLIQMGETAGIFLASSLLRDAPSSVYKISMGDIQKGHSVMQRHSVRNKQYVHSFDVFGYATE